MSEEPRQGRKAALRAQERKLLMEEEVGELGLRCETARYASSLFWRTLSEAIERKVQPDLRTVSMLTLIFMREVHENEDLCAADKMRGHLGGLKLLTQQAELARMGIQAEAASTRSVLRLVAMEGKSIPTTEDTPPAMAAATALRGADDT